jgi:hypothetical protein
MAQCNGLLCIRVMLFLFLWYLIASGAYRHVPDVGTRVPVVVFSKSGLEMSWSFCGPTNIVNICRFRSANICRCAGSSRLRARLSVVLIVEGQKPSWALGLWSMRIQFNSIRHCHNVISCRNGMMNVTSAKSSKFAMSAFLRKREGH